MSSSFDLRQLVRDVMASSSEADPGVIANMVMERIDPADYFTALAQTLRGFVRQVLGEHRAEVLPSVSSVRVRPIRRGVASSSLKVSAIREAWQRALDARVHVEGGTKLLRDCTYEDLLFAAEERQRIAAANSARARQFREIASAVLAAGVGTVGELSAEDQMRVLGGVA